MRTAAVLLRIRGRRKATICIFMLAAIRPAYSQSSATVMMDHGEFKAGDTLNMSLSFDRAATCRQAVWLQADGATTIGERTVVFHGVLEAGENATTVSVTIPKDYQGEFHTLREGTLFPCDGYSQGKDFTVTKPVTFNVRGIPDINSYPVRAEIALTLTQRQFLATKVADLNDLSSQIDTRVERSGNDSVDLRYFLGRIVEKAEADLVATEGQYRRQLLKPEDSLPAFFADFRRRYTDIHDELKAPIPGTGARLTQSPHLLYVRQSLKQRPEAGTPARSGNLSGTFPAIASATKLIVEDNASAYRIVNSTGRTSRPEFHARLESLPTGATIYYRQAILIDFKVWSSKTDVKGADFELATFVFKFHKDECSDEPVVTIDPYSDTHPDISVEFKHCRKK